MLKSDIIVANVRKLCHERINLFEADPLVVAALELCDYHLTMRDQAIRMEELIHDMAKAVEA